MEGKWMFTELFVLLCMLENFHNKMFGSDMVYSTKNIYIVNFT